MAPVIVMDIITICNFFGRLYDEINYCRMKQDSQDTFLSRAIVLMDDARAWMKRKTAIFDKYGDQVPAFVTISTKASINSGLCLVGVCCGVSIIFMLLIRWTIVIALASAVYPSVFSIRALENKNKSDIQKCLTYWMFIGVYTLLDTFIGFFLDQFTLWNLFKLGTVTWLMHREMKGAQWIHENVLKRIYEDKELIQKLVNLAKNLKEYA